MTIHNLLFNYLSLHSWAADSILGLAGDVTGGRGKKKSAALAISLGKAGRTVGVTWDQIGS